MSTRFLLQHYVRDAAGLVPEATAVRHDGRGIRYEELEERSNRIARALAAAGTTRGDRVVVHAPKSIPVVETIYGVMKAGAAYVPVEPGMPAPRLAEIVGQCRPRGLVTWSGARAKLDPQLLRRSGVEFVWSLDGVEPFTDLPIQALDAAAAAAAEEPEPLATCSVETDLAYVLFTSGSTGTPKGVMLSHRNALTFVDWVVDTFELSTSDRLSNHAPFNFDLSVLDLFGASAAGASVTLVPEGLAMFPSRLAELIEQEQLTVWYSVPSVLALLVSRGSLIRRSLRSLRWILFAGEVFPVRYLRELMSAIPTARYANLYGPTETNVVTWYEVPPLDEDRTENIPIGKACANSDCVVLDDEGNVVIGVGREGVLHVRGGTVMQGYFGRSEETAAAFVPSPEGSWRDDRLYCTGDWVALDERGDYRYLGRRDHMVKTGGHRVELGEIEAALYAHPAVTEVAAVAVPDEMLGNRIVAVVVASGASARDLRQHCAGVLPRYMVPHEIEFRGALPRTSTDKVDRTRILSNTLGSAGRS